MEPLIWFFCVPPSHPGPGVFYLHEGKGGLGPWKQLHLGVFFICCFCFFFPHVQELCVGFEDAAQLNFDLHALALEFVNIFVQLREPMVWRAALLIISNNGIFEQRLETHRHYGPDSARNY